jgi:hypothetical protein
LNQDLHLDVNRYVEAAIIHEEDNQHKFLLMTLNRVASAYLRIWEIVIPSPTPFAEDIQQVISS